MGIRDFRYDMSDTVFAGILVLAFIGAGAIVLKALEFLG
jgi:hypothetical protein